MAVIELFQAYPWVFVVASGLLGLIVGSFLNVVVYRLPLMMEREWKAQCAELLGQPTEEAQSTFNLAMPPSRCTVCDRPIRAIENIPVISYLMMRGRCACGRTSIAIQYPLVELLSGVLTAVVAWHFGASWQASAAFLLTWALIALSIIDIKHQLLPDAITLPWLWLGLALALFGIFVDLRTSVIGAMAGYLALWSVFHLYRLLTDKEGFGYGDFKLLSLLGAWQGWQALGLIIILSSVVGAVVGIGMMVFAGRDRQLPMPFGPYLAIAGWISLLWGSTLTKSYLQML